MSGSKRVVQVSRNALCMLLIVSIAFSGLFMTGCKKAEVPPEPVPAQQPTEQAQPTETKPSGTPAVEEPTAGEVAKEPVKEADPPGASSEAPGSETPQTSTEPGQPAKDDPPTSAGPVVPVSPIPIVVIPESTKPPALFPVDPKVSIVTQPKVLLSDSTNRLVQFEMLSPAALYASSGPGKPASLPGKTLAIPIIGSGLIDTGAVFVETKPYYTAGHRAAFVQRGGDEKLWFATLLEGAGVAKIVWQVSGMPFDTASDDWRNPRGLIQSGEIGASTREFVLDFAAIHANRKNPYALAVSRSLLSQMSQMKVGGKYLNPQQTSYFVRAVAVDSAGKRVGAAGRGVQIIYGGRLTYQPPPPLPFTVLFDLLPARYQGQPLYAGDVFNDFHVADEKLFQSDKSYPWYFRPQGFPKTVDTILLQVSRSKLPTSADNWRDPAGLVYELELKKGTPLFDNLANSRSGVPVDFNSFAKSMLGTKLVLLSKNIEFHIRAVALDPGKDAGTVRASYSKSVKVVYGRPDSQITYYPPPETVSPLLPTARLKEYQPVKWEQSDWMYYYEVVRQPTYGEYFRGVDVPSPFKATDPVPGLTVGTVIKLQPPAAEDKSWLAEAWDTITSYFSSLASYIAKVSQWVSRAYDILKARMVEFVVQNMPMLPQYVKDKLQDELTEYMDYSLTHIGLPPQLPSFDRLASVGVDYLAAIWLDSTGIPTPEMSMDTLKAIGGAFYDFMSESANSGSAPNPLNWTFVRQWTEGLYRPAYILLELHNPHKTVTPPATLEGRIFRNITQSELSDGSIMSIVSAFGNSKYFELFLPVRDVQVPRLLPGQTMIIPIFLIEYTGSAYPFHPARVTQNQFLSMYNNFDYVEFSFRLRFELPSAQEYSKELNLPQDKGYEYSSKELSIYYKGDPTKAYKK